MLGHGGFREPEGRLFTRVGGSSSSQQAHPLHHRSGHDQSRQSQEDRGHSDVEGIVQATTAIDPEGLLRRGIPGGRLGRRLQGGELLVEIPDGGQEADAGRGMEDLLIPGRARDRQEPDQRDQGHRGDRRGSAPGQCLLEEQGRGQDQRDGGEQLIGDAEQGPQGIDASQGVAHALDQEPTPPADNQRAGQGTCGGGSDVAQGFPQLAQGILEQVSSHAGAGIERRQDEQRLEHDGEVIPHIEPAPMGDL